MSLGGDSHQVGHDDTPRMTCSSDLPLEHPSPCCLSPRSPPAARLPVLRVEDAELALKGAVVVVGCDGNVTHLRFEDKKDAGKRISSLPCLPASLDVDGCKLSFRAIESLAKRMASGLLSLDLEDCNIGPVEAVPLANMLGPNCELRTLLLNRNKIGPEGAMLLANQLHCTRLENLGLSSNRIGPSGAAALAEKLPQNTTLTWLSLAFNGLGPEGAAHIAPVFGLNMTLTAVHLMGNSMGTAGIDVLREVLEQGPYQFSLGRFIVRRWVDEPPQGLLEEELEPLTAEQADLYSDLMDHTPCGHD